jgi:hypothetical protein
MTMSKLGALKCDLQNTPVEVLAAEACSKKNEEVKRSNINDERRFTRRMTGLTMKSKGNQPMGGKK